MKESYDIDISDYSTFKLPSRAKRLVVLESIEEIENFFKRNEQGSYYLIGAGSNTLLSPEINCLVKLDIRGVEWGSSIKAYASEDWNTLVLESVERGYTGLEPLVAIPGTVGAAPVQNIGAYGKEFSDVCLSVYVFDIKEGIFKTLDREWCQFSYRSSLFKKEKGRFIIIYVEIKLDLNGKVCAPDYPGIQKELVNKKLTGKILCDVITKIRWSKLPRPERIPNVGSCFENPIISEEQALGIQKNNSDLQMYPMGNGLVKISAGWLIDRCGLKGKCIGGVCVSSNHALVLINEKGDATMEDCKELIDLVKKSVESRFGISLTFEPNLVV